MRIITDCSESYGILLGKYVAIVPEPRIRSTQVRFYQNDTVRVRLIQSEITGGDYEIQEFVYCNLWNEDSQQLSSIRENNNSNNNHKSQSFLLSLRYTQPVIHT